MGNKKKVAGVSKAENGDVNYGVELTLVPSPEEEVKVKSRQ